MDVKPTAWGSRRRKLGPLCVEAFASPRSVHFNAGPFYLHVFTYGSPRVVVERVR